MTTPLTRGNSRRAECKSAQYGHREEESDCGHHSGCGQGVVFDELGGGGDGALDGAGRFLKVGLNGGNDGSECHLVCDAWSLVTGSDVSLPGMSW